MTPRRYFAFGCLTLLIQGGVLASQNRPPPSQLNAGSAMGTTQSINLSLAMQASRAQTSSPQITNSASKQQMTPPATMPAARTRSPLAPAKKPKKAVRTKAVEAQISPKQAASSPAPNHQPTPEHDSAKPDTRQAEQTHQQPQMTAKQGVTHVSENLSQPTFSTPPQPPNYPKIARKRGQQGSAMIEVKFNQLGEQLQLTLIESSGYHLLDKAALSAVKQWQFAAPIPHTAQAYTVRVPVTFALNN